MVVLTVISDSHKLILGLVISCFQGKSFSFEINQLYIQLIETHCGLFCTTSHALINAHVEKL